MFKNAISIFIVSLVLHLFFVISSFLYGTSYKNAVSWVVDWQIALRNILMSDGDISSLDSYVSSNGSRVFLSYYGPIDVTKYNENKPYLKDQLQRNLLKKENLEQLQKVFPKLDEDVFLLSYDLIKTPGYNLQEPYSKVANKKVQEFLKAKWKYTPFSWSVVFSLFMIGCWIYLTLFIINRVLKYILNYREVKQKKLEQKQQKQRLSQLDSLFNENK